MNIREKCPCGHELELTHVSLKVSQEAIDAVWAEMHQFRADHRRHREAALEAHVTNLANRGAPTIYNYNYPDLTPMLEELPEIDGDNQWGTERESEVRSQ